MFNATPKTLGEVVDWGLCVGCGACAYACKPGGIHMTHVEQEGFRPVFDDPSCRDCTECISICPGAHVNGNLEIGTLAKARPSDHEFGPTLEIWEGWASDPDVRFKASSGGLLSALSLYCLERGGFAGVIHAGMDPVTPWMNRNHVSQDRDGIMARAGSRYAPSAPCSAIGEVDSAGRPHVFIGKPCDAAAASELKHRDAVVQRNIGLILTFFCAGTPSTRGTLDLMDGLEAGPDRIREVRYRGEGWPGRFRVITETGEEKKTLSYKESWGKLTSYRPLRCNLCPDGLGRVSDIACGDAWDKYEEDGDPGRSLVLVRTELGRRILHEAEQAGYVTLRRVDAGNVLKAQVNLLERRRQLFGRLLAFRLLGAPVPRFEGFSLLRSWLAIGPKEQARTVLGTMRRIVQRRWYRRRPTHSAAAKTVEA